MAAKLQNLLVGRRVGRLLRATEDTLEKDDGRRGTTNNIEAASGIR